MRSCRNVLLFVVVILAASLAACGQRDIESVLAAADAALAEEDYQTAIIEYRNVIGADDTSDEPYLGLGRAYLGSGDPAQALIELSRVASSDGALRKRAIVEMARAHLRLFEARQAIDLINNLPGVDGDAIGDAQVLLAEAAVQLGDYGHALDIFARVSESDLGLFVRSLQGRAAIALERRNTDKALVLLDRAVKLDADNLDTLSMRSKLHIEHGRFQSAASDLQLIVSEASRIGDRSGHVDALNALFMVWVNSGDIDNAGKVLNDIRNAFRGGVLEYRAHALLLMAEGKPKDALIEAQKALALNPNSVALLLDTARIGLAAGQSLQAEQYARRAVTLDRNSEMALRLLANIHITEGRFSDADFVLGRLGPSGDNDIQRILTRAYASLTEGNYDRSIQRFENVLRIDPGNSTARSGLARAYVLAGRLEQASTQFGELLGSPERTELFDAARLVIAGLDDDDIAVVESKAVELTELYPEDKRSWLTLALVYQSAGDLAGAEQAIDRSIMLSPSFEGALRFRAEIRQLRGDNSGALADLGQIASQGKSNVSIAIRRAQILEETGDVSAAIETVDDFLKLNPNDAAAWFGLARLYFKIGEIDQARTAADRTAELDPDDPRAQLIRAQMDIAEGRSELALRNLTALAAAFPNNIGVLKALGRLYLFMGRPEEARSRFAAASELPQSDTTVTELLCEATVRSGRTVEAIACSSNLLSLVPRNAKGHSIQGRAMMLGERYADAVSSFDTAYRLSGSRSDLVFLVHAQLEAGIGEPDRLLAQRLSLTPGDDELRLLLADTFSRLDHPNAARQEYEKILIRSPENVLAANNLAWMIRDSEPERAERIALGAAKLAPDSVGIVDTAGWILLNNGKTSAAVKYLRQAAELGNNNPEVLYHLAVATEKSGDVENATEILQQALRIEHSFASREEAKSLLRELTGQLGGDGVQ